MRNKFTSSDVEEAARFLAYYTVYSTSEDKINLIKSSYGVNLLFMANTLYEQCDFFDRKKPHICHYLSDLGIEHEITYFRPTDVIPLKIQMKSLMDHQANNKYIRDPNKRWGPEDVMYYDDIDKDAVNPMNIFYRVNILIRDNGNSEVIMKLATELGRAKKPNNDKPMDLMITDVQAYMYSVANKIIECIHKYF